MDDDWETQYFGNLTQTASGDFDSDGMTNGEEYAYGFNPTVSDAYEDADADRYPNVFEVKNGADPNDAQSIPTPAIVVDGAGGGTHTTLGAAVSAANGQSGTYKIIGIAPGVYTGAFNLSRGATLSTKKLLVIGLQGAEKTIFDGGGTLYGWDVNASAVISSLTMRRTTYPFLVSTSGEVRFVDLLVRDNASTSYAGGVHISSGGKTHIIGCTFLNNSGNTTSYTNQIYVGSGTTTILNTVVWGQNSGTMLAKSSSATLTTNYDLVKGQTLSGTGNLAGTLDAKLSVDGHLLWDSPLRGAGGSVAQSRIDMDGELRPASSPDIGVDQFVDSDNDELADSWEIKRTGNLTTLTSRSQDADGDGLTNEQEYANDTLPTVVDSDGDGVSDGDELIHGTDPLKADTDGDDMPDGWEIAHGLAPLTPNAFDDADGDRYPNVFEYAYSSDPSDGGSTPTPAIVVDGAGGGTHTTMSAAVSAASGQSGTYKIIGIAPGVYTGDYNLKLTATLSAKKLLLIGLEGAGKTIFDGGGTSLGWNVNASAVISSLTMRRTTYPFLVSTSGEVRFVDLLVRDNASTSYAGGVHISSGGKTYIIGCTFLNNSGNTTSYTNQIYVGSGTTTILNTVVWGQNSGTMLAKASSATLTTNYDLVKGQTLPGTGNLAGTSDAKLSVDGHLLWDSPLRGAGGSVAQSRIDMDGELRPASSPDIGVDQFVDSDNDELADWWELQNTGNLTSLTSRDQDADGDGLSNEQELLIYGTLPSVADTDGDGLSDGDEVAYGTNPLVRDSEDLTSDLNGDGIIDSIGAQLRYGRSLDNDGDSISNADEVLMCTDPLRSDTDGDGVPDNLDALPLDPLVSALSSNPQDLTAPVITLTAPWYAVEQ